MQRAKIQNPMPIMDFGSGESGKWVPDSCRASLGKKKVGVAFSIFFDLAYFFRTFRTFIFCYDHLHLLRAFLSKMIDFDRFSRFLSENHELTEKSEKI